MKKIIYSIFVSFLSLVILFAILELSIRLAYENISNYNMEMWRYSKELKIPTDNDKLPFVHLPNKSAFLYGAQVTTNSHGFRINESALDTLLFNDKILFLGDSFTLGWGVDSDSTFPQLIQKWFNNNNIMVESINAGCGNYNTIMEVELFKKIGVKLKPTVVVLGYYINDIEETPHQLSSFRYYLMTNFYIYGFLFDKYVKIKSKYDKNFINNYYMNHYSDLTKKNNNFNAIVELSNLCKENGIELLIVNIPDLRRLVDYPYIFANNYIKETVQDLNLELLDLYEIIKSYHPETLWVNQDDPHANSWANYLFAIAIYEKLNEMNWLQYSNNDGFNKGNR